MKTCNKCGPKPLTEFSKDAQKRDGLCSRCKSCNAQYRADHREESKPVRAKHYADNREKLKATQAEYNAAHRDERAAYYAKWRADNPEVIRINNQNYRASKREAGGKLSKGLAKKLHILQRGKCACGCRQPLGTDYHRDHRMPIALGGANEDWNIQLLRKTCNHQKHAKHPVDFMQSRGFLL